VVAGLLGAYSIRSSFLVNFEAPDSARDPLVYTQSSPDVPRIARDVLDLSINQTRTKRSSDDYAGGLSMPFIIDSGGENGEGSMDWPFSWYFRYMKRMERRDATFFANATADSFKVKAPDSDEEILAPVVMVSANHVVDATKSALDANYVKLYDGQLNWWFPEGDKCNPTGFGYRSYFFSSLSVRKAMEACPGIDTTQLPTLFAPLVWPFDTSHWGMSWKYIMYRQLPETLTIGGREIEVWVRKDLAGSSASSAATTTTPTYKMVAERVITLDTAAGPRGIAVARDGTIVVADSDLNQIHIYGNDGTLRRSVGSRGNGQDQFNEPRGVAVGPDGSIYVADTWNARVVKLSPTGDWVTSWGNGATEFGEGRVASVTDGTEAGNQANPLGFFGPRGIAVSQRGEVFIADTGNKRIVVTDSNGNYLYQWGSFGSDPGKFNEPVGVAVDVDGAVIVGDTWNGRVQYFSTLGNEDGRVNTMPIQLWKVAGWQAQTYDDPYVTVFDGNAFASIPKRNAVGTAGIDGNERFRWGGNGTDNASFMNPSGLAASADGRIYVLDRGNNRILVFAMPQ
jgi:DNA-binding beta-propeller fold protein YncE